MDLPVNTANLIDRFLQTEYRTDLASLRMIRAIDDAHETTVFFESRHKQYPGLIHVIRSENGYRPRIIPYHLVREKHNRQIASFWIGKGICNVAEIKERSGRVYSRYAPSYELDELPHRDVVQSNIGLWMHDCLTEDFDHGPSVNRASLPGNIAVSFDFGMAFSHPYFPPFYTFELGIDDEDVAACRQFVFALLTDYARKRQIPENDFIADIRRAFPAIINPDLCRYYFRNFKTYIFKRLRLSRLVEKIRNTPFPGEEIRGLLKCFEIPAGQMDSWDDFQRRLSTLSRNRLDLRGLNLSGANLRKARLMEADLREANLRGADLRQADLNGADLTGTDLREADLRGVRIDAKSLKKALV